MDLSATLIFLGLVAVGSYIQTESGFAIALVIMGGVTALGLESIAFTANVVIIVALVNTAVALFRKHHQIDARAMLYVSVGLIPMSGIGLLALRHMSYNAADLLAILLGIVILGSGVVLFLRPHPLKPIPAPWRTSSQAVPAD